MGGKFGRVESALYNRKEICPIGYSAFLPQQLVTISRIAFRFKRKRFYVTNAGGEGLAANLKLPLTHRVARVRLGASRVKS